MAYSSRDPRPLSEIAIIDQETIDLIAEQIPAATWGNIEGTLYNQTDLNSALSGKEPANSNIQVHVISAHAPSNAVSLTTVKEDADISGAINHSQASHAPVDAQKNSDITKDEIEAKLTGELTSHSHAGGGGLS